MTYDIHIHSCLSPCAEDEMTPSNIAGFAKLNGIELLAVTDHNSAENLPAVEKACQEYGLVLLPGLEVTTAEEIHLLTYFKTVGQALAMSRLLYENLPPHPYDPKIWGRQLIMDENDTILQQPEKLLSGACTFTIYEVAALCRKLGGIPIPAHVDKDSTSLLSVLGFAPEDLPFDAFEVKRPEHALQKLVDTGRLPAGKEILTSSDAHQLCDISEYPRTLGEHSILLPLLGGKPSL